MSSRRRAIRPTRRPTLLEHLHSTRLQLILYSLLLVATPFVLLQSFLVDSIGKASRATLPLGSFSVPIVPTLALILTVVLAGIFRKQITRLRLLGAALAVGMITLAQLFTDYYFDHEFYDLQQNWHYIAYGIFAFMMFRDLAPRGRSLARIILITYLLAVGYSTFDEAFQFQMSRRVFDIGDISKDLWGCLIGMILVLLGGRHAPTLLADRRIRREKVTDYLKAPFSLLILLTVLGYGFVVVTSLLTEREYALLAVGITLGSFVLFFLGLHGSRHKPVRIVLLLLLVGAVSTQAFFLVRHRDDQIVHFDYGLTVYKGVPIPLFDVMIQPDGWLRPVDKKHFFSKRDLRTLLEQEPDILLMGTGEQGRGGQGFAEPDVSQFIYNPFLERGTQVIRLPSRAACREFNRLKRQGKRVLLVLHSK